MPRMANPQTHFDNPPRTYKDDFSRDSHTPIVSIGTEQTLTHQLSPVTRLAATNVPPLNL